MTAHDLPERFESMCMTDGLRDTPHNESAQRLKYISEVEGEWMLPLVNFFADTRLGVLELENTSADPIPFMYPVEDNMAAWVTFPRDLEDFKECVAGLICYITLTVNCVDSQVKFGAKPKAAEAHMNVSSSSHVHLLPADMLVDSLRSALSWHFCGLAKREDFNSSSEGLPLGALRHAYAHDPQRPISQQMGLSADNPSRLMMAALRLMPIVIFGDTVKKLRHGLINNNVTQTVLPTRENLNVDTFVQEVKEQTRNWISDGSASIPVTTAILRLRLSQADQEHTSV